MTKKQRFMTAVRGEVPDMVPVSPLIHSRYANKVLGRTSVDAWCEVHQMVGSIHHRGNGIVDLQVSLPEGWSSTTREVEHTPEGRITTESTIQTPHGTLTSQTVRGVIPEDPQTSKTTEYYVKDLDDWEIYRQLSEQQLAGIGEPNWDEHLRQAEFMGEEAVPLVWIPSPFCHRLMEVRGMQEIMMDLYDCPDVLRSVLEIRRQILEKELEAVVQSPAEVFAMDICWATGAGLGPQIFEEWALPDVVMAAEAISSLPGKYFGLYTLGRIRQLVPMWVDAGVDFVETFEPNEGDISLAEAKQLYGDRICLVGNFDCVVLAFGTVDEARAEARRCLDEGMEGGGYVMATADEVPADCKMDNLKAMVETVEEYGRYD